MERQVNIDIMNTMLIGVIMMMSLLLVSGVKYQMFLLLEYVSKRSLTPTYVSKRSQVPAYVPKSPHEPKSTAMSSLNPQCGGKINNTVYK